MSAYSVGRERGQLLAVDSFRPNTGQSRRATVYADERHALLRPKLDATPPAHKGESQRHRTKRVQYANFLGVVAASLERVSDRQALRSRTYGTVAACHLALPYAFDYLASRHAAHEASGRPARDSWFV